MADSSSLESLLKSLPPDKLESLLKNLGYKRESEETTESSLDCTDSKLEVEEKTSDVADDVDDVDNIDVSLKFKTRGNEKFNRGDFQGAIDDYTKATSFDESNATFYMNRAACHIKLENYESAIQDCNTALSMGNFAKAYARRASARMSLHQYLLAAQDFKSALELEPNNSHFSCNLKEQVLRLLETDEISQYEIFCKFSQSSWRIPKIQGNPIPRFMTGSTLVFDEKKNRCILYGGRNVQEEMNLAMELDLDCWFWSECNLQGKPIPNRSWHAATLWNNCMIISCGLLHAGESNDLGVIDLERDIWLAVSTLGELPTPRSGHSACIYEDKMYIFGGRHRTRLLNDVVCCSFSFKKFRTLESQCIYGTGSTLTDSHEFDQETKDKSDTEQTEMDVEIVWECVNTTGMLPHERDGHGACIWGDNMVIYGGNGEASAKLCDMLILDMNTLAWSSPRLQSDCELPSISYFTFIPVELPISNRENQEPFNVILVYGGHTSTGETDKVFAIHPEFMWCHPIQILNFISRPITRKSSESTNPRNKSDLPVRSRAWHSTIVLPRQNDSTEVLIFGGGSASGPLNDVMIMQLKL